MSWASLDYILLAKESLDGAMGCFNRGDFASEKEYLDLAKTRLSHAQRLAETEAGIKNNAETA